MNKSSTEAPQSLDNMKPIIKRLLDLRADKKDLEAEIKEIEGTVKEAIADRGKMQLDNYVFECKTMQGRKTIDRPSLDAFLAQHGKSYDDFVKQMKTIRRMGSLRDLMSKMPIISGMLDQIPEEALDDRSSGLDGEADLIGLSLNDLNGDVGCGGDTRSLGSGPINLQ